MGSHWLLTCKGFLSDYSSKELQLSSLEQCFFHSTCVQAVQPHFHCRCSMKLYTQKTHQIIGLILTIGFFFAHILPALFHSEHTCIFSCKNGHVVHHCCHVPPPNNTSNCVIVAPILKASCNVYRM